MANIKTVKLGTDSYELLPKYIQDTEGNAKVWQDIVDLAQAAKLQIKVVDSLPTASADTMHYLYLVPEEGTVSGTYVEYITIRSGSEGSYTYTWEKIGSTHTDLSNYVKKGTYTSASDGAHTHTVSGSVTVPTVSKVDKKLSASASGTTIGIKTTADAITGFGAHTTDNVLGSGTGFVVSGDTAKTNIKATASGAAIGIKTTANAITGFGAHTTANAITGFGTHTTADAITGFGAHTTADVLGKGTTFSVSGNVAKTNIKATASGTALSTSDGDFVTSYPGVSSKMVIGSVTGINGSVGVPSSVSTTAGSAASWSASVNASGELSFSWSANTPTAVTVGDDVTVAKPASSASNFVTGLSASGTGDSVLTGLGTAVTSKALTAASVSAQPTIALATDATAGAGVVEVATGNGDLGVAFTAETIKPITALGTATTAAAITALGTATTANAITALGTPTTAAAATAIEVTAQPTIALATGATAGTGVIEVATGVGTIAVAADSADRVDVITALGTPTTVAAATAIEVTAQPIITLDGDAASGVEYVKSVTVGSESASLTSGSAAEAGAHTHTVTL